MRLEILSDDEKEMALGILSDVYEKLNADKVDIPPDLLRSVAKARDLIRNGMISEDFKKIMLRLHLLEQGFGGKS
jgi:hypothetical protein